MRIKNLTRHAFTLLDDQYNVVFSVPREDYRRCATQYHRESAPHLRVTIGNDEINVPVNTHVHDGFKNLPEPGGDVIYIVSRPVALEAKKHDLEICSQLYVPDELVRANGKVVGCLSLSQVTY